MQATPPTTPDKPFDFADLEARIIAASQQAFEDVRQAHPKEQICAFSLYSDDGAMTVCPAFDLASRRAARIAKYPDEADYNTFGTAEWALEAFGARKAFTDICTTVRTFVLNVDHPYQGLGSWGENPGATGFASFKTQLFETCQLALEKLRSNGTFDAYPNLLVMFAVSDDGDQDPATELRMLERHNGASPYVEQYRRWSKTWAE
ncbi:MAG TPA: DUF4303 domain-containing protein [Kofleriaceae bacterium]|nr:DUF4303 domain-containing protein [Kofleriaceae bacterium]